jgi:hypothetical protein
MWTKGKLWLGLVPKFSGKKRARAAPTQVHLGLSADVGTLSRKRLHEQGVSDDNGGIEGTTKKSRFVSGVVSNNGLISVEAVGQPRQAQ